MKERPIIFSDAMVRAILQGRKTQTRQVIKNKTVLDSLNEVGSWDGPGEVEDWERSMCPYGAPGDRLWVRECFAPHVANEKRIYYRADGELDAVINVDRWKPPIHMPRWASRITLEIISVRVQRVRDISEDDARAEGVISPAIDPSAGLIDSIRCRNCGELRRRHVGSALGCFGLSTLWNPSTYRGGFAWLWDRIQTDSAHQWIANTWIWAIDFRRVEDK